MIENQKIRPAKVIGPLGEPLTLETLPPADTTRWVVRRKDRKSTRLNSSQTGALPIFREAGGAQVVV